MESVLIRLTPEQAADVDSLIGRYGSTRPEIVKYFLVRELDRFDETKRLQRNKKGP